MTPAALSAQSSDDDEDVFELSPFEVTAEDQSGYKVTSTLAGNRIKTDLKDVASSISVYTDKFLKDTGATDNQSLLTYTTNAEVGGIQGNFSGMGGSATFNENSNLLRPNNNTRVRGLDAADNTRDFFLTEAPWDGYNVDRVEMQRGPNSILFGVGSPAGIINASTKTAIYEDTNEVEFRLGSFGTTRGSFDVNRSLIDQTLAVRVSGLYEDTQFRQDPAFDKDKRIFAAIRWEPKIFGEDTSTTIKANFENGSVTANRPRSLPPVDNITPWFQTGETNGIPNLNKLTLDPNTAWNQYGANPIYPNGTYPWFREAFFGRMFNPSIANFYNAGDSTPINTMMGTLGTGNGLDVDGNIDGTISALPFARLMGVAGYSGYAGTAIPGGKYYSDVSISDDSIFNFYDKLIDGDNKREWQDWTTVNVSFAQTFLNHRVGYEVVYFDQAYDDGQYNILNGNQYSLGIDINTHLLDGSENPNVGRPFIANSGQFGNQSNVIDRDSLRATAYADFHFQDVMEDNWLSRTLGRHVLTGLYSEDNKETDFRNFSRWASDPAYAAHINADTDITSGTRAIDWATYLGPSLLSASSAAGANLSNISMKIDPSGPATVNYFDSTWNATGVAFDDPYTYISYDSNGDPVTNDGFQVDNPDNYVGWTNGTYNVLSAENGDIDSLYSQTQKSLNEIESQALTLQSYFFNNSLVATYGWRKDTVKNTSAQGDKSSGVSDPNFNLSGATPRNDEGQSRSWGAVYHLPKKITKNILGESDLSFFYNKGENFKADAPRGDVFGNQIDNPRGETEEYGFALSTAENRLSVKMTWYETKVSNATLSSDNAGFSGSLYYVWALPYWGASHALAALDGIADPQLRQGSWGWPWNNIATTPDGSPDNARIGEIVEDFFTNFPLDQHFADEYGLNMNVEAMRAGTTPDEWYAAVPGYGVDGAGASNLGLQTEYGGQLRSFGAAPAASVDTTSKGIEIEVHAKPTDNWDLTFNVSKTEASRTAISPSIEQFIEEYTEFLAGDAGLIQLWGGDPIRNLWDVNVLAPYSTLKGQIGSSAPEVSPWRFNMVNNYSFNEGAFKGVNIGMGYRWEDKRVLGYQYDPANDILDINKPWYGDAEDHIDLWAGYGRNLNDKIHWRIQLNLRNVGESVGLTPVSAQPDGTIALSRIQEGMTWTLSNTFKF